MQGDDGNVEEAGDGVQEGKMQLHSMRSGACLEIN